MLTERQIVKISRRQLYDEIWKMSVAGVAKKYNADYNELLKLCKVVNVPIPPSGYWIKLKFGKPVEHIPLLESDIVEVVIPMNNKIKRVGKSYPSNNDKEVSRLTQEKEQNELTLIESRNSHQESMTAHVNISDRYKTYSSLLFLSDDDREKIFRAAEEIKIPEGNYRLHKKIVAYRDVVKEWNKKDRKEEGAQRKKDCYYDPPFLAGVISEKLLPRVYQILDVLFRQIEKLGGSVNDDLSLQVRNEHVHIEIIENQDKVEHVITKMEAQALVRYRDEIRHSSWASEPKIRKYDYVFNGRLRICIRQGKYFRDTDKINIESRLGEMLIELYEESEVVRLDREAREETARKQAEEERRKEERRKNYNIEVERTMELENAAQDFELACRIRAYIKAVESSNVQDELDGKKAAWVNWAMRKADWYDPTVARKDELLGEREYKKSPSEKALKKHGYW